MRLIHAVRELNAEGGRPDRDRRPAHRRRERGQVRPRGGRRLRLGPASARPYLDHAVLERALRETGADAAWVGWGFVAEDPAFAELCERLGVTFIGPSAEAMRRLGDKIGAKLLAEEVGVPVAPWSRGAVDDVDARPGARPDDRLPADAQGDRRRRRPRHPGGDLRRRARRRVPADPRRGGSRLRQRRGVPRAAGHRRPAHRGAGHRRRAGHGLGARRARLLAAAAQPEGDRGVRLAGAGRRAGAARSRRRPSGWCSPSATAAPATVEFLYEPAEKSFAFLEVNTRLQVEHPITEVTTGFDLVKAQLHVAAGGRLEGDAPAEIGHAVEARLNAEDPDRDFAPSPGRIALLELPSGPGGPGGHGRQPGRPHPGRLRLDDRQDHRLRPHPRGGTGAAAAGAGRHHRRHRGRRDEQGLPARPARPARGDRRQRRHRLDRPGASRGAAGRRTGMPASPSSPRRSRPTRSEESAERAHFLATAHGGRPQARHEVGRAVDLKLRRRQPPRHRRPGRPAPLPGRLRHGDSTGGSSTPQVERLNQYASRLHVGDHVFRLVGGRARRGPPGRGRRHRATGSPATRAACMRSPAPALVVASRWRSAPWSRPGRRCSCSRA